MKRAFCIGLVLLLSVAPDLAAQSTDQHLSNLVSNLILDGITLPGANDPGRPHAGHFTLGNPTFGNSQPASRPDEASIRAVEAFSDSLRSQFVNFPLGSSSGGFTYRFDSATGAYSRSSTSFGPAFAERATTIGRGKVSLGFNYQHTSFDTFGGLNLRDGAIAFYLPHTDCCSAAAPPPSAQVPGFEGDLVEATLDLHATTDTFAMFANFGVTNRLDIGVAVPISRVDLEANVRATIIRLSSADNPLVHTFVEGQDVAQKDFASAGEATGLGDVTLRTKYNFFQRGAHGVAAAVDVRLPTGDEDNLLGLGATQAKVFFIASTGNDRFSPHVNIGFTVSSDGSHDDDFLVFEPIPVSDEFNFAGGVEFVAHPRLTLLGDILGRTMFDSGTLEEAQRTFQFRTPSTATGAVAAQTSSTNPLNGQPYRQLGLVPGNLNLLLGAAGFKFNAGTNLLVSGNFLFPLNDAGLRDTLAFTFGIDYAF